MQPGGGYLYDNGNGNGNGNGGSGIRDGRGQPYRPPVRPDQQMTPQEREAFLMAAGRLAAEYLVSRGDLPPDVLEENRGQPAFGSQYHQQQPPVSRTFHFQGRPPAPQHHQAQAWPHPSHYFQGQRRTPVAPQRRFPGPRPFQVQGGRGPFQVQGGRGPFPKRPRQRPFPYGPLGRAPPKNAGQAAAAPVVPARKQDDGNEHSVPPAGEAGDSQPTAQQDVVAIGSQQTDEPGSSTSLGANASESS